MKTVKFFLPLFLIFTSCYYKPFIGYRLNKKGFKHFSKKEKFQGDNANPLRNYDVKTYKWDVNVLPKKKKLIGTMSIDFIATQSQTKFMFDLQNKMKVESYTCSIDNATLKHKGDILYLEFDKQTKVNQRITLTINYKGTPANLIGEGPLRWKKDKKDRDWISTSTEGIGPHFIMPCNLLLRDEADSVWINVTAPKGLVASANGRLTDVIENETTTTYKHLVTNTINIYNISFNLGHFITLKKPYEDINGVDRTIECVVLDYDKTRADKFYNQAPKVMRTLEELFGEFPWWNDGCRFIQSNFEAMEHQSGIALGSDYYLDWIEYNTTLVHELSHEWWGNNVTAYDYCDAWLHEGLATYAEALFIEKMYGRKDYNRKINYFVNGTYNQIPVHKKCNVLYSSWITGQDQDIYDKGALMMHSLRMQVDDDTLFFKAMKQFQKDMAKKNITEQQFIDKFNALLGKDYTSLFDLYLNQITPPVLEYYITTNGNHKELHYKWLNTLPFHLKKGISITLKNKKKDILNPTATYQVYEFDKNSYVQFNFGESIYFIFDNVKNK